MGIQVLGLDTADQRRFDHGLMEVAVIDDTQLVRAVFNPGWRWSSDIGPMAGTTSCQVRHAGIILAGRLTVQMDDGTQVELAAGDAHVIPPGHDAWVVGDEQCVLVDFGPAPVEPAGGS